MKAFFTLTMVALIFFPLNAFADECTAGDCQNGKGTLVFSTGHSYTGMFKGGVRHGEGILRMPGGRKIVGIWESNEIIEGTYTEPDGTVYEGQWRHRERNGQGRLTYPDGRYYVGEFKSGKRHGQGTMTYPDGRKYVGAFLDGERTGQGRMTYPDGSRYTGEFEGGNRTGKGVMEYADGRKEEGMFKNGEFVGN